MANQRRNAELSLTCRPRHRVLDPSREQDYPDDPLTCRHGGSKNLRGDLPVIELNQQTLSFDRSQISFLLRIYFEIECRFYSYFFFPISLQDLNKYQNDILIIIWSICYSSANEKRIWKEGIIVKFIRFFRNDRRQESGGLRRSFLRSHQISRENFHDNATFMRLSVFNVDDSYSRVWSLCTGEASCTLDLVSPAWNYLCPTSRSTANPMTRD